MRILFITDKISEHGGEGNYSLFFINYMRKRGHEIELICNKNNFNLFKKLYNEYFFSYFSPLWKKKIEERVKKFNPDIIFLFGITRIISPYSLKSVKNKVPIVFQMSGAMQFHYSSAWGDYFRKNPLNVFSNFTFFSLISLIPKKFLHNNLLLDIVDHYIAPSETTAKITKNKMGISERNLSVIRHPSLFEIANEVSKKQNFILYVGRLTKEKGIKCLIKAFKILDDRNIKDIKLIIVGEGPKRKKLEKFTNELCISKKVIFLGPVEHSKLKVIYQNSLVLILPSIVKENFGLVILEAMSQGTPVITTNIGGQKELIIDGYNGLLFTPGDYEDLSKKIGMILTDYEYGIMLSKNSINFSKNFSKEKHINEIEKLFKKIIKNKQQ